MAGVNSRFSGFSESEILTVQEDAVQKINGLEIWLKDRKDSPTSTFEQFQDRQISHILSI